MAAIQSGLEKLIGEVKFKRLKGQNICGYFKPYDAAIDAFCLNTYSYYVAFFFEKILAGMNWRKHLLTRGVAVITNTPASWGYEYARKKFFDKLNITQETPIKKYAADTVLFIGLQMPLHWTNMAIGTILEKGRIEKEDLIQMAVASFSMIPISGILGGPYGLYRDGIKKSAGLEL